MQNNGLSCHVSQSKAEMNWWHAGNDTITAHGACKYYWAWVWCYTANEDWTPVASFFAHSLRRVLGGIWCLFGIERRMTSHEVNVKLIPIELTGWMNEGSLYSDSWFPAFIHSSNTPSLVIKDTFLRVLLILLLLPSSPVGQGFCELWMTQFMTSI